MVEVFAFRIIIRGSNIRAMEPNPEKIKTAAPGKC
jgi:hypothetical protein